MRLRWILACCVVATALIVSASSNDDTFPSPSTDEKPAAAGCHCLNTDGSFAKLCPGCNEKITSKVKGKHGDHMEHKMAHLKKKIAKIETKLAAAKHSEGPKKTKKVHKLEKKLAKKQAKKQKLTQRLTDRTNGVAHGKHKGQHGDHKKMKGKQHDHTKREGKHHKDIHHGHTKRKGKHHDHKGKVMEWKGKVKGKHGDHMEHKMAHLKKKIAKIETKLAAAKRSEGPKKAKKVHKLEKKLAKKQAKKQKLTQRLTDRTNGSKPSQEAKLSHMEYRMAHLKRKIAKIEAKLAAAKRSEGELGGLYERTPSWITGETEAPMGEKDMGGWTMRAYTPEQQQRLKVDEIGEAAKAPHTELGAAKPGPKAAKKTAKRVRKLEKKLAKKQTKIHKLAQLITKAKSTYFLNKKTGQDGLVPESAYHSEYRHAVRIMRIACPVLFLLLALWAIVVPCRHSSSDVVVLSAAPLEGVCAKGHVQVAISPVVAVTNQV